MTVVSLCFWRQIIKVLNLYTPVIEFEERVSSTFIATIQVRLHEAAVCVRACVCVCVVF